MGPGVEGYYGGRVLSVSNACVERVYNPNLANPKYSGRLKEVLRTLQFVEDCTRQKEQLLEKTHGITDLYLIQIQAVEYK